MGTRDRLRGSHGFLDPRPLVGPNGSDKTTLFRLIIGEEVSYDGEISIPKKLTVGYFWQDVEESLGHEAPGGRS